MNVRTLVAAAWFIIACPAWSWSQTGNYAAADAQLNRLYQRIAAILTQDAPTRQKFVQSQRAWIGFRDADCQFAASGAGNGSAYGSVYQSCLERLTLQRVSDFSTYLHCREGNLACPLPSY